MSDIAEISEMIERKIPLDATLDDALAVVEPFPPEQVAVAALTNLIAFRRNYLQMAEHYSGMLEFVSEVAGNFPPDSTVRTKLLKLKTAAETIGCR
ncbi:MAG: hypothetical protein WCJ64_00540 [Rhodospirillaceae bacterium]